MSLYDAIVMLSEEAKKELTLQKERVWVKGSDELVAFQEGAVNAYANVLAAFKNRGLDRD